jgi:hypothetical protein
MRPHHFFAEAVITAWEGAKKLALLRATVAAGTSEREDADTSEREDADTTVAGSRDLPEPSEGSGVRAAGGAAVPRVGDLMGVVAGEGEAVTLVLLLPA